MRVILSRKGFDSSVGGHPSPVLPDGMMLSLPIPPSHDSLAYDAITSPDGRTCADVLVDLGGRDRIAGKGAHLDPDLIPESRPRRPGWRPSFGQIGAASGHLRNQGVGPGDLFLFYGWFRPTETVAGRLQFKQTSEGVHTIFGYLQVGEVIRTAEGGDVPDWLADHPHASVHRVKQSTNVIYVAAETSNWDAGTAGAGVFRFRPELVLSKPGMTRSCWALAPAVFGGVQISYHTQAAWCDGYFKSYPRAQEYVIEEDDKVNDWARRLIGDAIAPAAVGR